MKRYAIPWTALMLSLLMLLVLGVDYAAAACVHVDNQELIEYNCEAGSAEDLKQIPSNAEKIRISNMSVGRVTNSMFSRFGGNLLVLTCSHCFITDIEDDAFRRLENLQQLSLDNNHLKEVRASWFEGLVYLTYLDLNYNAIERIDGDVFRNAPTLVDLRISGNRISCLDIESISRLKDLKRIFLNENPNFGCPNAMRKFLTERHIDFEADPQWNSITEDRVRANEPLPSSEQGHYPTTPPYYTRARWTVTEESATASEPPVPPTPAPPPRRPYVPEMMQPSMPEQDFPMQGPYYVPKVPPQQQLDNYRSTIMQNTSDDPRNKTSHVSNTTPTVLIAGHGQTTTVATLTANTTDCPDNGAKSTCPSILIALMLAFALSACRWTFGNAENV